MVTYSVYAVRGVTARGTKRTYIGYTRAIDVRKHYHRLPTKPAFMRCWLGELQYEKLKLNIMDKTSALIEEAKFAAEQILQSPSTVRGGPWSSPKPLTEAQMDCIRRVSLCTTDTEIVQLAREDERSCLARHLHDLKFQNDAPSTPIVVFRMNRSGTPGHLRRKQALYAGTYKPNDKKHRQAHFGVDDKEQRRVETSSRPSRSKKK